MTKMLLLSFISIYILFTYQINQSLTFTISRSEYVPIVNIRSTLINEDYHQVIF
jgi:hypothetical protein